MDELLSGVIVMRFQLSLLPLALLAIGRGARADEDLLARISHQVFR